LNETSPRRIILRITVVKRECGDDLFGGLFIVIEEEGHVEKIE